jgi:hypothetical protein
MPVDLRSGGTELVRITTLSAEGDRTCEEPRNLLSASTADGTGLPAEHGSRSGSCRAKPQAGASTPILGTHMDTAGDMMALSDRLAGSTADEQR